MISDSKRKVTVMTPEPSLMVFGGGLAQRIAVSVPREKARRARSLMQTHHQIIKQRTMTVNAVKAMLRSVGVAMKQSKWPKESGWE
jgi:hypothetical protein